MIEFTREIKWSPAFDKRHADPKKNYGIHGVECRWLLKGPEGVIQFLIYTNWMLPHINEETDARPLNSQYPHLLCRPMPADLGYHSRVPHYEDQETMGPCEYLDMQPCYYDGSGLNAEPLLQALLEQGGEAVWKMMEEEYTLRLATEAKP